LLSLIVVILLNETHLFFISPRTPYSRPSVSQLYALEPGFQCDAAKGEKVRILAFSFALGAVAFRSLFLRASAFFFASRSQAQKKARALTSVSPQLFLCETPELLTTPSEASLFPIGCQDVIYRVRPFRFFFCFVILHLEAKRNPFRLVFAIFREKIISKFRMFSHVFASNFSLQYEAKKQGKNFASFRLNFSFRFASNFSVSLLFTLYSLKRQ
jgi:hypothetical protein